MTFDIYVWAEPRDLDADAAAALIRTWEAGGGDPARSPFEPSTDIGWFHRELTRDLPWIDVITDAVPSTSKLPIWVSPDTEAPARVIAIRLPRDDAGAVREAVDDVYSLAVKYDVVVYEPGRGTIHLPNREMADHASATFWPRDAIRTIVAILIGIAVAIVAWIVGIPLLSGGVALFALFMVAIFVFTLVVQGRESLQARRTGERPRVDD